MVEAMAATTRGAVAAHGDRSPRELRCSGLDRVSVIYASVAAAAWAAAKWAISTAVAHFLHTEGVTGSNPVSPIQFPIIFC